MRKPDTTVTASGESGERFAKSTDSAVLSEESEVGIIGPDIRGDDWTGSCYLMGGRTGQIIEEQQISAIVTQEGGSVTLTTSEPCIFYWGAVTLGTYYWGDIDAAGNMMLYDEQLPVQTWTTPWGPVTATSIMIGDYVEPPNEEDPYGDFYVIELQRDPVPPPPDPVSPVFLPSIYKLLLP